jgi:diacylglycerol kinase (ATP)
MRPPSHHQPIFFSKRAGAKHIMEVFHHQGLRAKSFMTQGPGEALRMARDFVSRGEPLILPAVVGTETSLGIIPFGTANAFALELGIPTSIEGAVKRIKEGQVRTVDVGKAGEKFFAMGASLSFEAHVIKKVTPTLKYAFGAFSYVLLGVVESFKYSFPLLKVQSDHSSETKEGYLVIVANARFYGGHFQAAPRALLNDGLLDVIIMKKKGFWNLIKYLSTMKSKDITKLPDVDYFQSRHLRITSDPPVLIHVDAEMAGSTPCDFECLPSMLKVIA